MPQQPASNVLLPHERVREIAGALRAEAVVLRRAATALLASSYRTPDVFVIEDVNLLRESRTDCQRSRLLVEGLLRRLGAKVES